MAEFVEFRAEEWISELEQMERIRLFEPKEVRTIASKRKEFEYKIQRRTKCKEDYLKYIQFEVNLHRIIKARRKKTGIKIKHAEIDYSQTHRIGNLFKQAVFKFQNDVKLWMSFFKFCKGVKFHSLVSQMLVRMLQIHCNKPDLWAFAATWEFKQCKSISNARQLLMRGLRFHPSCEMLYKELFNLELNHIRQKAKEIENKKKQSEKEDKSWLPDEVSNSIVEGKVAEVVYQSAVKAIPGVDFKVNLLNLAHLKKAPTNLCNKIFKDVVRYHLHEELAWDAVAQREFGGLVCDLNELVGGKESVEVEKGSERVSVRDRIQRSIGVYEEAVRKLNTPNMWGFYLDHVIRLNENVKQLPIYKAKLLKNAMEGAIASGNMAEKYFLKWVDILRKEGRRNRTLSEVLKKGTEYHPSSLPLWYARLRFYLSRDQDEAGMEVFNRAIGNLKDATPLWKLMVKYLLLKSSLKVEDVFKGGIKQGGEVAQALKPFYIEWLTRTKGIEEARRVFVSPEMNLPPCLELYQKMAAIEASQTPPAPENVRKCHELAVTNFGERDPGVWLEYVRFELNEGDRTKVAQIHRRALKSLTAELGDYFVTEFNNFKMEVFH